MAEGNGPNGYIWRSLGIAVSLIALLAGGAGWFQAVIQPMNTRMDALAHLIDKKDGVDEKSIEDRGTIHQELATMKAKFAEIETQFRDSDKQTIRMEDEIKRDLASLSTQLLGSQQDRQTLHSELSAHQSKFSEIETQFTDSKELRERDRKEALNAVEALEKVMNSRIDTVHDLVNQIGVFSLRGPEGKTVGK
jgi:chromosome segregation ATPase